MIVEMNMPVARIVVLVRAMNDQDKWKLAAGKFLSKLVDNALDRIERQIGGKFEYQPPLNDRLTTAMKSYVLALPRCLLIMPFVFSEEAFYRFTIFSGESDSQ